MSALEHAVPERFFNDPAQCNLAGAEKPVAGLPSCPQGISAVKALGLAAAQGQRIYTITPEVYAANPNIVNTALSAHSVDTKNRVQRALDSGMEVTIHQAPILESRWRGSGFMSIDPKTGSGEYTIEGGANGVFMEDNAPSWLSSSISLLMNMIGVTKNEVKALAGTFFGALLNAIDAFDVFSNDCYNVLDGFVRSISYFSFITGFGVLVGYGLLGASLLIVAIGMAFFTLFAIAINEAFMRCPIHSD